MFNFDVNYFFVTGTSRDNSGFAPSLASMSWGSGYRRFSIYIAGLTTDFSTAGYLCDYSEYNSWYEFGAKYVNKKLYWFGDKGNAQYFSARYILNESNTRYYYVAF